MVLEASQSDHVTFTAADVGRVGDTCTLHTNSQIINVIFKPNAVFITFNTSWAQSPERHTRITLQFKKIAGTLFLTSCWQ